MHLGSNELSDLSPDCSRPCWAFDNLSLELQKSTEDNNFTEELEEFLKIMDNNDVDEEDFYKYLEFEHEDEDCAMSTSASRVSDSDQEPTSHWQPESSFLCDRWQLTTLRDHMEISLERVKRSLLPVCVC